jgi:CarD family transcriptional regulator
MDRRGTPIEIDGERVCYARVFEDRERIYKMTKKSEYKAGDFVVYPTHGVGRIMGTESQEIAGTQLDLLVIDFEHDRMTLRIPLTKAKNSGLRRLSSRKQMDAALIKLKGRARVRRTMWSRRAQEYEAKINSGDPVSIAEVVRDLRRNTNQSEQSYSERQMYQAALDRLAREFAAIEKIDEETATQRLEKMMMATATATAAAAESASAA